jgi:hypothetical protein
MDDFPMEGVEPMGKNSLNWPSIFLL